MGFQRVSNDFQWVAKGFPKDFFRFSLGFPEGLPMDVQRISKLFHKDFLWISFGCRSDFQWISRGISNGFHKDSRRFWFIGSGAVATWLPRQTVAYKSGKPHIAHELYQKYENYQKDFVGRRHMCHRNYENIKKADNRVFVWPPPPPHPSLPSPPIPPLWKKNQKA